MWPHAESASFPSRHVFNTISLLTLTQGNMNFNVPVLNITCGDGKKSLMLERLDQDALCYFVWIKVCGGSDTYELYQLKVSQLRPSSWYSLSALPFLYSLEPSSFFQSAAGGRSWTQLIIIVNLHISRVITTTTWDSNVFLKGHIDSVEKGREQVRMYAVKNQDWLSRIMVRMVRPRHIIISETYGVTIVFHVIKA